MSGDLIDTTEMYLKTVFELEEDGVLPMRARIAERLGTKVIQGYGLTETSPVTHMDLTDARAKPGSIGPPLAGTEQRVVDMETGIQDLPPGERKIVTINNREIGVINVDGNLKHGFRKVPMGGTSVCIMTSTSISHGSRLILGINDPFS